MEELTLFGIIAKGGVLTVPLVLCSLIMVVVAVERFLAFKKARMNVGSFMLRIRGVLSDRDVERALRICQESKGPIAAVFESALEKHGQGRAAMKEAIEDAGSTEVFYLERYLGILATVAAVAPLIGFLGTVTGMIKAFIKIESLGGNVNAEVLAGGIWEAMVTTAEGLAVGIPALILYNYFVDKIQKFVFDIESNSTELLDLMEEAVAYEAQNQPDGDDRI